MTNFPSGKNQEIGKNTSVKVLKYQINPKITNSVKSLFINSICYQYGLI